MVTTVMEEERVRAGDKLDAELGAAGLVDLTVVEVEVAARVVALLVVTAVLKGLVVTVADVGTVLGGGAEVVLLGRVTNAKGVGVGGRDTPGGHNSSCEHKNVKWN